ncbi:MAG: glycosyltransferase [Pseudomonadota bacterium]
MPAPISVVIPTLNAAGGLAATLASLNEGWRAGLLRELILTDGGSNDGIETAADQAGAMLVRGAPSRGQQLRRGISMSSGDWLLVLHADTVLLPGWSGPVARHLERSRDAAFFRLTFDADGFMPRLVAGWANLRARWFGLAYGDQGLLVPRALYEEVGGYPNQALMEDVTMTRLLRGRLKALTAIARTSADRYRTEGWLWRGGRNLILISRYALGADPAKLAMSYRNRTQRSSNW